MKDSSLSPVSAIRFEPQKLILSEIPDSKLVIPEQLFDPKICKTKTDQDLFFPLIVMSAGDKFIIIDGCKRFSTLKNIKIKKCVCCITEQPYQENTAGLLRIHLNKNRNLELREKIIFSRWLKIRYDKDQYISALGDLGINKHERQSIELLQNCPDKVIDAVESGKLEFGLLSDFLLLGNDSDAILDLFTMFSFTRQTQKELLEWLPQLAYSKRCSVNKILENENFVKINENRKLNDPQKMAKIRDLVFTMKFPNFMRVKESWKKLEKNTNPDPVRVQFKPSEAFEKNRLEIRITVADPENTKEIFDKLHLISGDIWKKLIYPFQDN
ncbi:MAG TPA: hypothetical protein VKY57_10580 [Chitinispirillaceae bacterium]|nr:hypothetical protein [Chitinispirillaceae bacterium]